MGAAKKTKIILDTDIGSEMTDAAALTLAAISPEIELLGVTTVTHDSVFRASVAKKFLDLLGYGDIPVAAGFGAGGEHEWEKEIVFPEGYAPSKDLYVRPAWQLILDLADKNKGDVTLVGIGTTTNLAQALAYDAELPKKVSRLVLMGGMMEQPIVGGKAIPRGFEYNFCSDSESAEKIIKSGFNLTLVPGDLTFREDDPWTEEELTRLANMLHPAIKALSKLNERSLVSMREGMKKANLPLEFAKPWVNDEILMAYLIKPELFKTKDIFTKWELPDKYPRLIPSAEGCPLKVVSETDFLETRKFILDRFADYSLKAQP
jgi:purine nucleosidase